MLRFFMKYNGKTLTTDLGAPIANDQNMLTVGARGPALMEDVQFLEKLAHFDRERIPERVVHAKGVGVHGVFQTARSMSEVTTAHFLQEKGRITPVFVRFSTVIGSQGSADTARDPRGFAVKFYTEEGNYDIVGNNIPVFFIRDAIKFPDVIHSLKPAPDTNLVEPERFWDFYSQTPEATHMITWLYSDRGTIKNYRKTEGFGVNTFIFVNKEGRRWFVKFHWKPLAGIEDIDRKEAEYLAGVDPDVAVRDVEETILKGGKIEYDLCVQLMPIEKEYDYDFDPLDDTKIWPENLIPLIHVGRMTLNRLPQNFFAETEQSAFCPANIVPGIEFSADKMLQGRVFSYSDTQRYRLGANFLQLPINSPRVPVMNNQQNGAMRYFARSGSVNYSPNTLNHNVPMDNLAFVNKHPMYVKGYIEKRAIPLQNDFQQAGERYLSLSTREREHLVDNILHQLVHVDSKIQNIVIGYFMQANKEFGEKVYRGIHK